MDSREELPPPGLEHGLLDACIKFIILNAKFIILNANRYPVVLDRLVRAGEDPHGCSLGLDVGDPEPEREHVAAGGGVEIRGGDLEVNVGAVAPGGLCVEGLLGGSGLTGGAVVRAVLYEVHVLGSQDLLGDRCRVTRRFSGTPGNQVVVGAGWAPLADAPSKNGCEIMAMKPSSSSLAILAPAASFWPTSRSWVASTMSIQAVPSREPSLCGTDAVRLRAVRQGQTCEEG